MRQSTHHIMQYHLINYVIAAFTFTLISCSETKQASKNSEEVSTDGIYTLTKSQFQSSNMTLGKLETKEFHEVLKCQGTLDVYPENRVSVSTYYGGYIKNINILPGVSVRKGETLFVLESPDYIRTQQHFLEAKGQLIFLKSNYERQKELIRDNIASQKDYLKAEADYTVTKAKYESLKKQLELMNINTEKLTSGNFQTTIRITAPISGYITEVNVVRGEYLSPSEKAVTLINTDHIHLELNIFEQDLSKIAVGQPILFTTQYDTKQTYKGEVYLINKMVDSKTRTIGVHGHLANPTLSHQFTLGMYVEAKVYTTSVSKLALPADAIVEIDGSHYVLVKKSVSDEGYSFEKRKINKGMYNKEFVEILNNNEFNAGTEFLTSGVFNLIKE